MKENKKSFWLSYDLGIKGNYDSLYSWLDNHEAKECGDSFAFFTVTYRKNIIDYIKKDLKDNVKFNPSDRIYLIWFDDVSKGIKGRFIIGGRKRAPWQGYGWTIEEEKNEDF